MKKLRQDYKKIKDKHKQTGMGRTSWKFYGPLNEMLGTQPATHPPFVLDTLDPPLLLPKDSAEIADEKELDECGSRAMPSEDSTVIAHAGRARVCRDAKK